LRCLCQVRKFSIHVRVLGVLILPISLRFFNSILELFQLCGIFCFSCHWETFRGCLNLIQINLFISNLTKIRSVSCFPLLTCHSIGDLWKPQYGLHASDAMLPSNENDDWETIKILLKCIPYYEQSEWPKRFVVWFP
jgi:hypothetical protein